MIIRSLYNHGPYYCDHRNGMQQEELSQGAGVVDRPEFDRLSANVNRICRRGRGMIYGDTRTFYYPQSRAPGSVLCTRLLACAFLVSRKRKVIGKMQDQGRSRTAACSRRSVDECHTDDANSCRLRFQNLSCGVVSSSGYGNLQCSDQSDAVARET
jgi:hypothetical protein